MRVLAISLAALSIACSRAPRSTARDRNVIRADEIAQIQAATAHDIVARLRSEFLRSRGAVTRASSRSTTVEFPKVTVFLDGVEAGPVEQVLPQIPASEVFEIRLYRATDAVTKYGSRHTGGVIVVTTKRAQPDTRPRPRCEGRVVRSCVSASHKPRTGLEPVRGLSFQSCD